ncbi:HET-domain-containing protein, partial [Coniophora puteana RWD-64-598 SS2]
YATLSHRWGQKEATYAEYKQGSRCATEPGYVKLRNFLDEASARGMQFAWADTCCIDKSSSAELDEAIRSMFRWYRNSALCIVHLAQTRSVKDISHDAWFTRGWTLQELLAPPKIKFVDQSWKPLVKGENDKDILQSVSKATGIGTETLSKSFEPRTEKFSEKMSWASRRSTTRAEDAAYSLMGMLNVSFQTAYGEGGPRAFRRLLDAVVRKAEDPSVM